MFTCEVKNRAVFLQVFNSLSLFENSLEKVPRLLLFLIHVWKGSHPFSSSVCTISRSSKTTSVNSQLQHTDKCYLAVIIISGNVVMCLGEFLCDAESLTWCANPERDLGSLQAWPLMEAILRSNGHHKEGSKLKPQENSTHMQTFNIVKGFFAMEFQAFPPKEQCCSCSQFSTMLDWMTSEAVR